MGALVISLDRARGEEVMLGLWWLRDIRAKLVARGHPHGQHQPPDGAEDRVRGVSEGELGGQRWRDLIAIRSRVREGCVT